MAHAKVNELRETSDKAWAQLRAQLQGMEPYLDKSDAPGQWTTREVLSPHALRARLEARAAAQDLRPPEPARDRDQAERHRT